MKFVNVGFGNMVSIEKVIAVVSPESAPVKRMIQEAKDKGLAIDATQGKKTVSVIICDSDHIVLSAISSESIMNRVEQKEEGEKEDE